MINGILSLEKKDFRSRDSIVRNDDDAIRIRSYEIKEIFKT